MNWTDKKVIRVAILDMYEGYANQGMRCIREILNQFGEANNINLSWDEFEVRLEKNTPDLSYDIYISTGGPGSPLESEGSDWEKVYFIAHKMKSSIELVNIESIRADVKRVELNAKTKTNLEEIPEKVAYINTMVEKAASQMKREFDL